VYCESYDHAAARFVAYQRGACVSFPDDIIMMIFMAEKVIQEKFFVGALEFRPLISIPPLLVARPPASDSPGHAAHCHILGL
jgi:hypothetical protein